ncbi:cupin domain-containing protein, partial [Burkholderia stabilis]
MDALSQLLSLGRSRVELDVRCLLDGPFAMPHDPLPPGEAAFHLLLAGTCRLRTADGRTLQLADHTCLRLDTPADSNDAW